MSGKPRYNYAIDTPVAVQRVLEHLDRMLAGASASRFRPIWLTYPYAEKHFNELGRTNPIKGLILDSVGPLLVAAAALVIGTVVDEYRVQGWTVGLFILLVEIFSQLEMHRLVSRILPALGDFRQIEQVISGDLDPAEIFQAAPFPWNVLFLGAVPTAVEDRVSLVVSNLDWYVTRSRHLVRWTWVMMVATPACFQLVFIDISYFGAYDPIRSFIFSIGLFGLLLMSVYSACSRRRLTLLAIAVGWLERRYILQFRDNSGED